MKVYAQNKLDSANGWATRGIVAYVPDGGIKVAQLTLRGGVEQQSVLHESPQFRADGTTFWARAWWKFPLGYSWEGAPNYSGREHKLMCISVAAADGKGRVLLNAQGGDGHLRCYVEGFDGSPGGPLLLDTNTLLPLDGIWHHVEVQIDRAPSGAGRARVWLDGRLAGDARGTTGFSPFTSIQVGAFVNQGAAKSQSFNMRDFICADEGMAQTLPPVDPPVVTPPKPSEYESIARELESCAKRVRALEPKR